MGSRMYYSFYGDELDDQNVFEERIESVLREIGERGKVVKQSTVSSGSRVSDDVPLAALCHLPPPPQAPAAAAAPPATPSAAARVTPATSAPEPSYSPSIIQMSSPVMSPVNQQVRQIGGLAELSGVIGQMESVMEKQHALMLARDEKVQAEHKAERAEMKSELRAELDAKIAALTQEAVAEDQFVALQARLERLHAASFFSDDELYAIEDMVSDFIEVRSQVGVVTNEASVANPVLGAMKILVALSGSMPSDAAFSRQVRRKFINL